MRSESLLPAERFADSLHHALLANDDWARRWMHARGSHASKSPAVPESLADVQGIKELGAHSWEALRKAAAVGLWLTEGSKRESPMLASLALDRPLKWLSLGHSGSSRTALAQTVASRFLSSGGNILIITEYPGRWYGFLAAHPGQFEVRMHYENGSSAFYQNIASGIGACFACDAPVRNKEWIPADIIRSSSLPVFWDIPCGNSPILKDLFSDPKRPVIASTHFFEDYSGLAAQFENQATTITNWLSKDRPRPHPDLPASEAPVGILDFERHPPLELHLPSGVARLLSAFPPDLSDDSVTIRGDGDAYNFTVTTGFEGVTKRSTTGEHYFAGYGDRNVGVPVT